MKLWIVIVLAAVFFGGGCKPAEQGSAGSTPADSQLAPQSGDDKIAAAVKSKFESDPELKKEPITVEVKDGRVTLSGTVSNDGVRAKADELAREVPDVFGVDAEKLTTK